MPERLGAELAVFRPTGEGGEGDRFDGSCGGAGLCKIISLRDRDEVVMFANEDQDVSSDFSGHVFECIRSYGFE